MDVLAVQIEDVDICATARDLVEELRHIVDEKNITLTLTTRGDIPHLNADKTLSRIILQNLLSNAIKYTPSHGKVEVELSTVSAKRETLFIRVSDSGIGIPKTEQSRVFEKLQRASNAQALVPDGTGLGLYVVKAVVEKVGGGITFESAEGKGSTFYVSLPFSWTVVGQRETTAS